MATNGNGKPKKPRTGAAKAAADATLEQTAVDPWERQHGEGDERWEAFQIYRDQIINGDPKRSLRRVAAALSKSSTLLSRWAGEDSWSKRVEAWDREQDAMKRAAMARDMENMVKRQSTSLSAAAQALLAPIQAFLVKLQKERAANPNGDPYDGYDLRELMREAREAARLLPSLIQAERLVAGLSTTNHGGHDGGPIDVRVEEARRRARAMSRGELEHLLLGDAVIDGTAAQN